jgi:hypothetical protein
VFSSESALLKKLASKLANRSSEAQILEEMRPCGGDLPLGMPNEQTMGLAYHVECVPRLKVRMVEQANGSANGSADTEAPLPPYLTQQLELGCGSRGNAGLYASLRAEMPSAGKARLQKVGGKS